MYFLFVFYDRPRSSHLAVHFSLFFMNGNTYEWDRVRHIRNTYMFIFFLINGRWECCCCAACVADSFWLSGEDRPLPPTGDWITSMMSFLISGDLWHLTGKKGSSSSARHTMHSFHSVLIKVIAESVWVRHSVQQLTTWHLAKHQ